MVSTTFRGYMDAVLHIGDRVMLSSLDGSESIPIAIGSTGFIAGVLCGNSSFVTVSWDVENRALHSGDGSIARGHAWDVRPKCLSPEMESPMDATMQSLVNAIDKAGQYLMLNGTIFEIKETALRSPSELIRQRDSQVIFTFQQKLEAIKTLEQTLRRKYDEALLMPMLSINDIKNGIYCYSDGGRVHIVKEIQYEPLTMHRHGVNRKIRESDAARLKRKVIADVTIPDFSILLRDTTTTGPLQHYHSMSGNDCIGTIDYTQFQSGPPGTVVARAVKFMLAIESLFKVINIDNIAHQHPQGMPEIDELYANGTTVGEIEGVLVSQPVPIYHDDEEDYENEEREEDEEPENPRFSSGDEVETSATTVIIRPGITPGMHGIICGGPDEWNYSDGWRYAVQLDTAHSYRHSCEGECDDDMGFYFREYQLIPYNESNRFRVGDRVEVTHRNGDASEGDIGYVRHIVNSGNPPFGIEFNHSHTSFHDIGGHCPDNRGYYMSGNSLTLAPFIVGDVVSMRSTQGSAQQGAIGIIRTGNDPHDENSVAVEFNEYSSGFHACGNVDIPSGHGYWVDVKDLQLYTEEAELVIGDKIVMIQNHDAAKIGDIGTIVTFDGETLGVDFENVDHGDFHNCGGKAREGHGHWVLRANVTRYNAPIPVAQPPRLSSSEIEQGILSI